jgi:hypothetical protein
VTKLNTYRVVVANLKEKEYVEILGVGGKIILTFMGPCILIYFYSKTN